MKDNRTAMVMASFLGAHLGEEALPGGRIMELKRAKEIRQLLKKIS